MDPAAGCLNPPDLADARSCVFGPDGATNSVVVVGDSISISWLPGVRAAFEPLGYRVHGLGLTNCPFADTDIVDDDPSTSDRCNAGRARIYEQINAIRPSIVIVSGSSFSVLKLASGKRDEQARAEWQAGNDKALAAIAPSAARVVILAPNPPGPSPAECVTRFSAPSDCVANVPGYWSLKALGERDAAAASGAKYVDTSGWFCDAGVCPVFAAGAPIRWDGQHMTATYSRLLAPYIERAVLG